MKKFTVTPSPDSEGMFLVVDQNGNPAPLPNMYSLEVDAHDRAAALEDEMLLKEAAEKNAVRQSPGQRHTGPIAALSPSWILLHAGRSLFILHPRDKENHVNLEVGQKITIQDGVVHVPSVPSLDRGR